MYLLWNVAGTPRFTASLRTERVRGETSTGERVGNNVSRAPAVFEIQKRVVVGKGRHPARVLASQLLLCQQRSGHRAVGANSNGAAVNIRT